MWYTFSVPGRCRSSVVEHVLGKDEAVGSIPTGSSRHRRDPPQTEGLVAFLSSRGNDMPTVTTDSAKRALLEQLIDDASLFPPAKLAMVPALRAHARHAESAYAWLGGKFVLPASRGEEFALARAATTTPIELSVILDAGLQAKGDTVRADLERVARIRALPGVTVSSLEARLPRVPLDAAAAQRIVATVAEHWPADPVAFWYESSYDAGWATPPAQWLAVLAAARAESPANLTLGAKVRCGGPDPGATPSVEDLAAFVIAAQEQGVPWKATAGLHHPVRGEHGVEGGVVQHGFLNLFVAAVALHAGALEPARVAEVLGEHDPRAFVVDPLHLGWREVRIEAEAVAAAREHVASYGQLQLRRAGQRPARAGHHRVIDPRDYGLDNLPFGIVSLGGDRPRAAVAFEDRVIDLDALVGANLLDEETLRGEATLNAFFGRGLPAWRAVRARLRHPARRGRDDRRA